MVAIRSKRIEIFERRPIGKKYGGGKIRYVQDRTGGLMLLIFLMVDLPPSAG
jgi:hypothetical protein